MKKTSKTRLTRWLSCIVTLSLCFGSLGIAAAPSKAEPELSAQGFPLLEAEALPETVRELIGLKADATQKVVQTDNPYEIQTENADGSGQGTLFAAPVKYVDEDGQIRFIDSSIVRKGFFRSLFQSYTYTNAANSVQVEYSPESAKGVRLNGGVIMAVTDTKQPDDMPGFVREEAGKDDVFVYPQAFGPDTYVEYSNTAGGVKENIVLEKNVGRNEFAFTLETATHTPVLSADNTSITLVSKTNPGEGDYLISSLYVYDSYQPDGTETAEDFRHYTEDCLYRLEAVEESVYIDPTVSGTASTMDDAFISPTVTGASNYKASYLRVGKNGNDHYAYLRFGNLPSKPANVDVSSATLKLTYRPNQTTGGVLDCYYVGSSWVGKDLTWNNQPSQYAPGSTYDPQGRNYSIASFDVATHLQNWTNGGYNNYGLCISYNNLSMNDYNSVYSSDGPAASVPRIEYSYTGAYGETSGISSGTIYYLRNVRSGKYMDVQGGGTNVVQYSFHGDTNQQWYINYIGNGMYDIIPAFKTGYRLDVGNANDINGTKIGIHTYNGSNAQKYRIISCGGGYHRLQPLVSTRKVVEVSGANLNNSAQIQIWDYVNGGQQQWYLERKTYKNFQRVNSVDYVTYDATVTDAMVNSINSYGTKSISVITLDGYYARAQYDYLGGPLLGLLDASTHLRHFLEKKGVTYIENVKRFVNEAPIGKYCFEREINNVLEACESMNISQGVSYIIASISPIATAISPENSNYPDNITRNKNWWYALGDANGYTVTTFQRLSTTSYSATINYHLVDYYDWDENNNKRGGFAEDSQMSLLHQAAYRNVMEYLTKGCYSIKISWNKGQRLNSGATYSDC